MSSYIIEECTKEDLKVIDDGLVAYNASQVPFIQADPFKEINKVIKDDSGEVIAGIVGILYCWNCLAVHMIWVKEEYRNKGLASRLLSEVERIAKEDGGYIAHLDTFSFQAKDFYIKKGYEVCGVIEDNPKGHTHYFMKKNI